MTYYIIDGLLNVVLNDGVKIKMNKVANNYMIVWEALHNYVGEKEEIKLYAHEVP
jgi:hypothetical protein